MCTRMYSNVFSTYMHKCVQTYDPYIHRHKETQIYVHTYIHTYTYVPVRHVHPCNTGKCMYVYLCLLVCFYACICVCVCLCHDKWKQDAKISRRYCACMFTYIYIHIYIYIYIYIHIHTYIYTYIHTYMHTYIHTSMHACMLEFNNAGPTLLRVHVIVYLRTYTQTRINIFSLPKWLYLQKLKQ
jgi:hypothetical protein